MGLFRGQKQFNPDHAHRFYLLVVIVSFGVIGGIIALIVSMAAPTIVVNPLVPQPRNVRAFADDHTITVVWDGVSDSSVVGYYLTYKKKGAAGPENVRQTIYNSIQLQPLNNGQEYEISVHSARGEQVYTEIGPLAHANSEGEFNKWARADGNVSQPVVISATPSDAYVNAQRSRLTGFFDDFNTPANPFDELKWNNASSSCNMAFGTAAFINSQYHAHNMVKSYYCDRGGQVARPRAVFDTTGRTDTNPAIIEWDMDGVHHNRDSWYLDIIPTDARKDGTPLDLTSHNSTGHNDGFDPGNMIRINLDGKGRLHIVHYDTDQAGHDVVLTGPDTVCGPGRDEGTTVRWGDCNMTRKTPGISPIPQSDNRATPTPNVRRHWSVRMSQTKLYVYVDSALLAETTLPADFAAKTKFNLHSTMFTYNTGKSYSADFGDVTTQPWIQMFHWDNFGFSGPTDNIVTHNYIDGGTDGNTPHYMSTSGTGQIPRNSRTTVIKVPDEIGNPINNQGKLFFTLGNTANGSYRWSEGDHIIFNGRRYEVPNPNTTINKPEADFTTYNIKNFSHSVNIASSDIRQGNNTVALNINGPSTLNVHLELYYNRSGPVPTYTQPIQIYGQNFSNIVEPSMTNCDSYNTIEQDLGLPYLNGKQNMPVGPCIMLNTTPHHTGIGTILDARNFEAEEMDHPATVKMGSDPNASRGKFIQF